MNILYVIPNHIWPADYGGAIRGYNILKALDRNHEVSVALANRDQDVVRQFLAGDGKPRKLCALEFGQPSLPNKILARTLARYRRDLKAHAKYICGESFSRFVEEVDPDLVWYFGSFSPWLAGIAKGRPCVWDVDDLDSRKYALYAATATFPSKQIMNVDRLLVMSIERELANQMNVVSFSNPDDLLRVNFRTTVKNLPNGFDFGTSQPQRPEPANRVLFIGYLDYQPNYDGIHWFCREVWPYVVSTLPNAHLDIVGLGSKDKLDALKSVPNADVHGFVEDTSRFFAEAACMVVPLRVGGGTRIKILEAWSKGVPVVSTTVGCEGLGATDKDSILIGESAREMGERCVRLMNHPDEGAGIASRAYEYGKASFDWRSLYPVVDEIIETALASQAGTTDKWRSSAEVKKQ